MSYTPSLRKTILSMSIDELAMEVEKQSNSDYVATVLVRLYDPDTIAAILNSQQLSVGKAASILNSTNMPVDTAASILSSVNMEVDRAAEILNSASLAISKAASILNSANMPVDRAAAVLSSSSISASRIANIFASANLALAKIRDIVSSASWTRTTVLKELMLDDPVAAGRATYYETNSSFDYVYDATNLYGELTFPPNTQANSGNYAHLDFGSISVQPGDAVVFIRHHIRDPGPSGYWYIKLLIGTTEIFSRDIGPDTNAEYRHSITISDALTGNLMWRLYLRANITAYSMSDALVVLLVLR